MNPVEMTTEELLYEMRLESGNQEDILLSRPDGREGCMVGNDKYALMYQASRRRYDEYEQEILRRQRTLLNKFDEFVAYCWTHGGHLKNHIKFGEMLRDIQAHINLK